MIRLTRAQKKTLRMIIDCIILVIVLATGGWLVWDGKIVLFDKNTVNSVKSPKQAVATIIEKKVETEEEHLEKIEKQHQLDLKAQQQKILLESARREEIRKKLKAKELKWQSYYKMPSKCINPEEWKKLVDCKNKRIVARKRFDKLYDSGRI